MRAPSILLALTWLAAAAIKALKYCQYTLCWLTTRWNKMSSSPRQQNKVALEFHSQVSDIPWMSKTNAPAGRRHLRAQLRR